MRLRAFASSLGRPRLAISARTTRRCASSRTRSCRAAPCTVLRQTRSQEGVTRAPTVSEVDVPLRGVEIASRVERRPLISWRSGTVRNCSLKVAEAMALGGRDRRLDWGEDLAPAAHRSPSRLLRTAKRT